MTKIVERNFLADEADDALKSMCDNVTETRYGVRVRLGF